MDRTGLERGGKEAFFRTIKLSQSPSPPLFSGGFEKFAKGLFPLPLHPLFLSSPVYPRRFGDDPRKNRGGEKSASPMARRRLTSTAQTSPQTLFACKRQLYVPPLLLPPPRPPPSLPFPERDKKNPFPFVHPASLPSSPLLPSSLPPVRSALKRQGQSDKKDPLPFLSLQKPSFRLPNPPPSQLDSGLLRYGQRKWQRAC